MELFKGSSSSSTTSYQQEVEAGNLLEECWFFGNLLISSSSSNPKMSRCNSDPCPSTNYDHGINNANSADLVGNAKAISVSSSKNDNDNNKFVSPKLVRAPSLPTSFMTAKTVQVVRQSGSHDSKEVMKYKPQVPPPRHSLARAPSLPPCIGREEEDEDEEEEDQESEFKLGRLIRQASLNSSGTLPPRQTPKSSSIPRRSRKKVLVDVNKELGNQYQINQTKRGKLPTDIPKKEVERSKSLISKFDRQSLEDEVSMYKASQEKNLCQDDNKVRRPYNMSDASAWHMTSSPAIPKWAAAAAAENDKRSPQDMKAQLKFWARAVASNARAPGVL